MNVLLEVKDHEKVNEWVLVYQKCQNDSDEVIYRFHWRSPEGKLITRGQAWIHNHEKAIKLIGMMITKEDK